MSRPARITTPFDKGTRASEVAAGLDLTGRRVVVTGASSGLGIETARALASVGAEVTLAVRDIEAGKQTAAAIVKDSAGAAVSVMPLELTDRASVAGFAAAWQGPLHVLVANAGVSGMPEKRTPEGWEYNFAANYLGHFALAIGLHDALAAAGNARIVALSSCSHALSPGAVDFDDIHFERRSYAAPLAYAQSKTANVLFAVEATRRWAADGIVVNAVHPGGVRTNLHRHMPDENLSAAGREAMRNWPWRTVEQGAANSVLAAASPLLEGVGGRYFENCNEALPRDQHSPATDVDNAGVATYATDPGIAARLWDVSTAMLRDAGWID
jgi:NAD(P)-dependent dehydrogenase (short-subunit alcohol dehydrogenase family)